MKIRSTNRDRVNSVCKSFILVRLQQDSPGCVVTADDNIKWRLAPPYIAYNTGCMHTTSFSNGGHSERSYFNAAGQDHLSVPQLRTI